MAAFLAALLWFAKKRLNNCTYIVGNLSSVQLFKGSELVENLTDVTLRKFSNLLSDTSYTIKAIYTYDLNNAADSTALWSTTIEHGVGKNGNAAVYAFQVYISIESIKNDTYFNIRYSASGAFGGTRQNDKMYYEMMYVVNQGDINSLEFY